MENWINTELAEQETTFNIDYEKRQVDIYTNRKTTAKKLFKIYGEPTKTYKIKNNISAIRYILGFNNKKLARMFSKTLLVGNLK